LANLLQNERIKTAWWSTINSDHSQPMA